MFDDVVERFFENKENFAAKIRAERNIVGDRRSLEFKVDFLADKTSEAYRRIL